MVQLRALALLSLAASAVNAASGSGKTTRYWDCCKGSCGWDKKAQVSHPITSCDKSDKPLSGFADKNGCEKSGGQAFMCTSQSPWAVNDTLSLGFAAVKLAGGTESSWCCACYKLTFTSGPVQGKSLIVQTTNTGGDLGNNHFDLAMPGGGVGQFNGCSDQWGAPSSGWGQQYGGISAQSACSSFPAALKPGCNWRFDWFKNADNPSVDFTEVTCPSELTAKTGCVRNGQTPQPVANGVHAI